MKQVEEHTNIQSLFLTTYGHGRKATKDIWKAIFDSSVKGY